MQIFHYSYSKYRINILQVTLQSPDIHDLIDADNIQIFKPPVFKICSEDFQSLGIHAHHFGILCFIVVYTIPGMLLIQLFKSNDYFIK